MKDASQIFDQRTDATRRKVIVNPFMHRVCDVCVSEITPENNIEIDIDFDAVFLGVTTDAVIEKSINTISDLRHWNLVKSSDESRVLLTILYPSSIKTDHSKYAIDLIEQLIKKKVITLPG